jgi:hypothetical protein
MHCFIKSLNGIKKVWPIFNLKTIKPLFNDCAACLRRTFLRPSLDLKTGREQNAASRQKPHPRLEIEFQMRHDCGKDRADSTNDVLFFVFRGPAKTAGEKNRKITLVQRKYCVLMVSFFIICCIFYHYCDSMVCLYFGWKRCCESFGSIKMW